MKVFGEDSPIEFIHPDEMAFGSVPDKPEVGDPEPINE